MTIKNYICKEWFPLGAALFRGFELTLMANMKKIFDKLEILYTWTKIESIEYHIKIVNWY